MKVVPFSCQIFYRGKKIKIFKVCKGSFYRISNPTFLFVLLLLALRKGASPSTFIKYSVINTCLPEISLYLVIIIGFVGKDRGLISTNQFFSFLRIMRTRCCKSFFSDNVRALVYCNMAFITIVFLVAFLSMAGIIIFLRASFFDFIFFV